MLSRMSVPEQEQAFLIDLCFRWILDNEETVAVKVYCMQIIANHLYPELKYELRGVIEDRFSRSSAGFQSRGRKILKMIEKMDQLP